MAKVSSELAVVYNLEKALRIEIPRVNRLLSFEELRTEEQLDFAVAPRLCHVQ